MNAKETIKELYHFEITDDNESDDCDLSWTDVVDLMNQFTTELEQTVLDQNVEIEELKSKVKGLSDLNNEVIMKVKNHESYISELESTVFNTSANLDLTQSSLDSAKKEIEELKIQVEFGISSRRRLEERIKELEEGIKQISAHIPVKDVRDFCKSLLSKPTEKLCDCKDVHCLGLPNCSKQHNFLH